MATVLIAKEEAVAALRAAAWHGLVETCGHPGCTAHQAPGPGGIHTFLGGIGADWNLDDAIAIVERADRIGWADHWARHDLAARADGKTYRFDVPRPTANQGATPRKEGPTR